MCCRFVILVVYIVCSFEFYTAANKMGKLNNIDSEVGETPPAALNTTTPLFSNWSPWSRCVDCFQRRMKKCIAPQCEGSRMVEEKPCGKKRCKRKARQRKDFHVVQLDEDGRHLLREAPSHIWSKWSRWSPCSESCRTQRRRTCRKPGRCRKMHEEQNAYCYQDNSMCQTYILHLLDHKQKPGSNYEYSSSPRRVSQSKKPVRKKCGQPFRKSRMLKIIGGTESRKDKWPWHVAILNKYYEVFCGGTLIGPRWVLTASHCIRPYLRVRLSEHDLSDQDGREREMTVRKMFQHPRFNHKTVDNDIALLQLPVNVKLPVACLPNRNPRPAEVCSVMGWGKIRTTDRYGTDKLHEAKLPVVHTEICKHSYRHFLITSNMLCAGWPSGKADTCAGDSGGGLMCPFKQKRSSRVSYSVQGITSFGDGCGLRNKYGIYTTVFNYLEWIYYIMDHYS